MLDVSISGCQDDCMFDVSVNCASDQVVKVTILSVIAGCQDDVMFNASIIIADCRDESNYCSVVKMMRLCRYANFKHKCCKSCQRRRRNKS